MPKQVQGSWSRQTYVRQGEAARSQQHVWCFKPRLSLKSSCSHVVYASEPDADKNTEQSLSWQGVLGNAVPAVAFALLLYYAAKVAPNQTPIRDSCAPFTAGVPDWPITPHVHAHMRNHTVGEMTRSRSSRAFSQNTYSLHMMPAKPGASHCAAWTFQRRVVLLQILLAEACGPWSGRRSAVEQGAHKRVFAHGRPPHDPVQPDGACCPQLQQCALLGPASCISAWKLPNCSGLGHPLPRSL